MFFSFRGFVLVLTAFTLSCTSAPRQRPERVAVLPFENLTTDPGLDWYGHAVAAIAAAQASGDARIQVFEAASLRDALAARADRVVQGYIEPAANALRIHASVHDENTRRNVRLLNTLAQPAGVLPAAGTVAAQLGVAVHSYGTASEDAVRALFTAMRASDAAAMVVGLKQALAADPNYGAAHLALAQALVRAGNREEALDAAQTAQNARLTPAEAAQLDIIVADLRSDRAARLDALAKLADVPGSDPGLWNAIGQARVAAKDYRGGAQAYEKYTQNFPDDTAALNALGYARALAGDLAGAKAALERYREFQPKAANPEDSLGEVHFYFGRYADAEQYFLRAYEKEPGALGGAEPLRAAFCRWMMGDIPKADEHMKRYFEALMQRRDSAVPLREALWRRMSGRPFSASPGDSMARSMTAIFMTAAGDRETARTHADVARNTAKAPPELMASHVAALLAEPSAPAAEWRARVERAISDPNQELARKELLGYALLLDRHFADAAQVWRDVYDKLPGLTDNDARMALAWALVASHREADARAIMPAGFFPPLSIDPGVRAVLYPGILDVLSKLARQAGNVSEADRLSSLFTQYSQH